MLRHYSIVAISIRVVLNRFGDHDPNGRIYVLKQNEAKVKAEVAANPFTPVDLVQPSVIRANAGDDVEVKFENGLPFNASMHVQGVEYDVLTSDGAFVGGNADTTVPPGGTAMYRWHVDREGIYFFSDLGNPISSEDGSNLHGLFGALIAEPRGSWWTDPVTGAPLDSGMFADVHHPLLPSFREFACFFHDEMEVHAKDGGPPIDPMTEEPDSTHNISYRAEPMRNRMRLIMEGAVCPGCEGEEVHHDSWPFGDPATPIFRTYVGDPMRFRVIHGGIQETHVFHHHVHQWLAEAENPDSNLLDSQAISPQATYSISPLYGAGSLQGAFGDVIYHCHLYPHFMMGMWGIHRVFNTLQDGSGAYPDGTPIAALRPLPDRIPPPPPTAERPGFPNFIPGTVGEKAPRPPLARRGGRRPTRLERNQFAENARPGAVFVNPCSRRKHRERCYHIVGIQRPIVYNRRGWHDPEGRLFVLREDEFAVRSGIKAPEPLVIRANAGECIRIKYTNKMPEEIGGNAFQLPTRTYETGTHIHFVKFDPLVSDGANIGWNYDSSAERNQTVDYQWYADVELAGCFFHDHLFATTHQQHGVFAGIIIEPRGSKYYHPRTGMPLRAGAQAIVTNPIVPSFREQALFVHDFALLFDKQGNPLNPPAFPGSHDDMGVMGVNYKNEPLQFRLEDRDPDPAYVFSSHVHGDPVTPILETYNGDPVRIRMFQGAQEESHSFNLHRQRWNHDHANPDSLHVQQQHIGISEFFPLEFAMEGEGDADSLYHYGGLDDVWLGCWGLVRSYRDLVPCLFPLPDRKTPLYRAKCLPEHSKARPPRAKDPGMPCPKRARTRAYEIVAMNARVSYNAADDHDPHGIIFALAEDEAAIRDGTKNPEPLILRANVGDCVEITLRNKLEQGGHDHRHHGYPEVPVDAFFPPSKRISLHPQMVAYDLLGSDGATVGYNPDQTIGPGETIVYRWYADREYGACNLTDMADLRNHRHHGAFGSLIIEPRGATYLDPMTLGPAKPQVSQVVVRAPLCPDLREFVLLVHDGIRLVDEDGNLIMDPEPIMSMHLAQHGDDHEDFEDQGSRAFNYRAERFSHRLAADPAVFKVFSSAVHGDPATPPVHNPCP